MRESVYDAMGGADAVLRLAHAWHERVLADEVVSHAFSHGYREDHTERLAAYWGQQLGGPPAFTEGLGGEHAEVLRLHSGNGEHREMNRRAESCFALAMADAGLPDAPELRRTLLLWFHWGVELMDSYPHDPADVPGDLPFPRWSWDGLVV